MNLLKSSLLLFATLIIIVLSQSCKDEDLCEGVVCDNDGVCISGECDCPDGYSGTNCNVFDATPIQLALDEGKTPQELFDSGIPLKQIYGRRYNDGLIFYLDTKTGTGLLASFNDEGPDLDWGCRGTDISENNNVSSSPASPETSEGAMIGDGMTNTNSILDGCDQSLASKLCRKLGEEWFLPSRGELNLIYVNLHLTGQSTFQAATYWSSTEKDENDAWRQYFTDGTQEFINKNVGVTVRPVKAF